jgi:dipeptidyl aminopeptidase/acylaminoacyl peptidase
MRKLLGLLLFTACATAPDPSDRVAEPAPASAAQKTPAKEDTPPAADATPTVLTAEELARDAELSPKIAAFVDAFANVSPELLSDGRVVFVSTRGTVPSLYVGDSKSPGTPPIKLETPDDRAFGISVLPDEKAVLFISDVRSDGNFRIFRTGLDGRGMKNLTPDETLHREAPFVARKKSGLFAYSAHASTEQAARIFVQDAGGGAPKMILRDEQAGSVVDFAPDGTRILFQRALSDDAQQLLEIEVATGTSKQLYPPDGKTARIPDASYSADGKRVFVIVQELDRPSRMIAIDRAKIREVARYEEVIAKAGSISGINVSPKGDRLVIAVDAGNHTEVRLLDANTLKLQKTVETGLGAAAIGRFRSDGAMFGLAFASAEEPRDIYAVDTKTCVMTPLRNDPRPGLSDLPKPKASIVEIASFDKTTVPLNVYLPAEHNTKLATFVSVHGGPSGSAYLRWSPQIAFFSAMGFAVVEPNIRGSTGFGVAYQRADDKEKRGDALKDIEAVNTWIRAQPWADPEKIVIGGVSYGGYMTLLALARQPKLWAAGINASGMSDLRTMMRLEDQVVRMYDETEFGILGEEDELLWEWSPLKYVDAIESPLFVYQGVRDPVSPQNEADQIVRAVRARGIDNEYMLLADEGHGVVRRDNIISYYARAYRFLSDRFNRK